MPNRTNNLDLFKTAQNRIQWIQRYLFELDALFPQPTPDLADRLGQSAIAVAPQFFAMVAALLFDAALLSVACLLDPPSHGKYKNVSMESVIKACRWKTKRERKCELRRLAELKGSNEGKAIIGARNKLLAHADFDTLITHPNSARQYSISGDDLGRVVFNLTDILDMLRPAGVPDITHPRKLTDWKGIRAVLQTLK